MTNDLIRKALVVVGCCFLTAAFVYLFYIVQLSLLTRSYVQGFKQGEAQCMQEAHYQYPFFDEKI